MLDNIRLIKAHRLAAWVLFAGILLYFISGYGMAKGIIDRELSGILHQNILSFIVATAFIIHASISTKYAFMRWRIWNTLIRTITIIIFGLFYLLFLYFQLFYQPATLKTFNRISGENLNQNDNQNIQKIFSISELAKYDGKNGNPAYTAIDGVVYDLTSVFKNDEHSEHAAGQDLTSAFYSQHAKSKLAKYPVVGLFK